jgi:hypothetical protein
MYALVIDGSISRYFNYPKGFTLGDLQYPADIFTKWSVEEKTAIGLYEVTFDNSNKLDEAFYINTNQTFTYDADAGTVTAAYGTATAKALADTLFTAEDEENDLGVEDEVKTTGLKTNYKKHFNVQAAGLLIKTDWYVVKATEVSDYSVPSAVTTYRAAVRTKVNAMETAIDNCANVAALITLLTYTEQDDGTVTRPLGEFPDEVV